jgi:drug/metabolite transporter (DMT)-like permease
MSPRLSGTLLLLLVSVLWSIGGVLIKSVEWHPMAIAGVRSAVCALVIAICTGLPRRPFSGLQIAGALAYAVTVISFVIATRLTTAANAIFLQYTAPIYVAILGPRLLGERTLRSDWFLITVALAGIGLFFLDRLTFAGAWGNVAGLVSGLAFGTMALLVRRQRDASPASALWLGNVFAALAGLPFMFSTPQPSAQGWWALIALGIFQLGLPYVLYSIAIKRVTALEAVLIPMLEPVLNPLWVMLVVGERPTGWALWGAALVLGAVLFRGLLMIVARRD